MRNFFFVVLLLNLFFVRCTTKGASASPVAEAEKKDLSTIEDEYVTNEVPRTYRDYIYRPDIQSLETRNIAHLLAPPHIELNSGAQIFVAFDLLARNNDAGFVAEDFKYTLFHCTPDWELSDLDQIDYLQGFYENEIDDVEHSFGTRQNYFHYQMSWPNDLSKPTLSGNYLLTIYTDDPEYPAITKRICVYEQGFRFRTLVHEPTIISDRRYKQEWDFDILTLGNLEVYNAYEDLKVTLLQNNRWDNAITDLQPKFLKGKEFVYDYGEENVFDGGNEWRFFDTKNYTGISSETDSLRIYNDVAHVFLSPDPKRTFSTYVSDRDINGLVQYKSNDAIGNNPQEDYIWVHFTLPMNKLYNKDVFVFGSFTQFKCLPEYKLDYDESAQAYVGRFYLKQGYYNYAYATIDYENLQPDLGAVEGNHFATENEYTLLAYLYDRNMGCFRLQGYLVTNSFNR